MCPRMPALFSEFALIPIPGPGGCAGRWEPTLFERRQPRVLARAPQWPRPWPLSGTGRRLSPSSPDAFYFLYLPSCPR